MMTSSTKQILLRYGVLAITVASVGGCCAIDKPGIVQKNEGLTSIEMVQIEGALQKITSNAQGISSLSHQFPGYLTNVDKDAVQLTPEEYAALRRDAAVRKMIQRLWEDANATQQEYVDTRNQLVNQGSSPSAK